MEVDWKTSNGSSIANIATRNIRLRTTSSITAAGMHKMAVVNSRYFIARLCRSQKFVQYRVGETSRFISCAVGMSLRTNTLYSDILSLGT